MTRPTLVLTFLLGASLAGAPSRLAAVDSSPFGVNVHAPAGESQRYLVDRTADAGIGWVRIDMVWSDIEPAPGVERWGTYDTLVAAARRRNLEILAILAYTPAWATDGPAISGVPRDAADWADFCFRAASRYRGEIRHWEIWNEPNLSRFWSGSRREYIETILLPGARAIRAADGDARVGGPGLSHEISGGRDWHGWLSDVLREAGGELDFVSHHLYELDEPEAILERLAGTTVFGEDRSRWHEVEPTLREVLAHAAFDGPVWLTETGWLTSRLDESRQAEQYRRFLELWLGASPAPGLPAKVFFYELQDAAEPRYPKYGLLRVSGRAKPSYGVLRDFIAAWTASSGDGGASPEAPQAPQPSQPSQPADPPQGPQPPPPADPPEGAPPRPRAHDHDG